VLSGGMIELHDEVHTEHVNKM